jgi:Tol biopolymer transport system component
VKEKTMNTKVGSWILCLVLSLAVAPLANCGGGGGGDQSSTKAGSVALRLEFDTGATAAGERGVAQAQFDCKGHGVATVEAQVLDQTGAVIATGGPWPCTDGHGTISNVTPGQNFTVVASAMDAAGNILYSGQVTGVSVFAGRTTEVGTILLVGLGSPPPPPTNVTATPGINQVALAWTAVSGATSYTIYWATSSGASPSSYQGRITDITANSYTHTGLSNTSTYYYVIAGRNTYGEGPASSEVSATPYEAIVRVSVASDGTEANSYSYNPSVSADGRYVAFESYATNLVAGDTNGQSDIFVHDRETGQTERVSVAPGGAQFANTVASYSPSISSDGRFVAFEAVDNKIIIVAAPPPRSVFVRDRQAAGRTEGVSVASDGTAANSDSYQPSMSADGRYVAFVSLATNLVPGDPTGDTNERADIFVHDRETGQTTRVSVASGGTTQSNGSSTTPSVSADGRYVAFASSATNLVGDNDTNGQSDIFVHDRQTGETERVSVATGGAQFAVASYSPSISSDGRFVAFELEDPGLPMEKGLGRRVFVRDRQAGTTREVSLASDGTQADSVSATPSISADGRYVAFVSLATNLVTGDTKRDTNEKADIFVHDRETGQTTRVSVAGGGTQSNGSSTTPSVSADGRYVAFSSDAADLVAGDTNNAADVFLAPNPP